MTPRALGRQRVERRVAHHRALRRRQLQLLHRREHHVGRRLAALHVALRHERVEAVAQRAAVGRAHARALEDRGQVLERRRRGEREPQPTRAQRVEQLEHPGEHREAPLARDARELLARGGAQALAVLGLGRLAEDRRDQVVAALADLRADAVGGYLIAVRGERPHPRLDVRVVRVEERAVHVEDDAVQHA
jgi:hypothetical protein